MKCEMKFKWMLTLILGLMALPLSVQALSAQESPALETQKDKVSYLIGVQVAKTIKSQEVDVDPNLVAAGLVDALSGGKLLMTDEELRATITALQKEMAEKQEQARARGADENKKLGEVFLAENAKKDAVITQPSGLQYKILKAAEGRKPAQSDTVVCHYRGTLIDGTEFDSSYAAGRPATFQVGGLIPGFKEALQLMPVGSTWQIFIPSNLAYGERGAGNVIGPNAALIFEVELISIR